VREKLCGGDRSKSRHTVVEFVQVRVIDGVENLLLQLGSEVDPRVVFLDLAVVRV
jgi:hypothetical protein